MIRAILDANIYVSALLKPNGPQALLLRKGFEGEVQIVFSEKIFLEICGVLQYPKIAERIPFEKNGVKKILERLVEVSAWTADELKVTVC